MKMVDALPDLERLPGGPRRCESCHKSSYEGLVCANRIGLATLWVCSMCAEEHGLKGPRLDYAKKEGELS